MVQGVFEKSCYFERANKEGVSRYVLKESPIEKLAEMIREVMPGKQANSPELAIDLFHHKNPLSTREKGYM